MLYAQCEKDDYFMYISYSHKGIYASAATSKRDGKKTSTDYRYLGRVIDRERGIYFNDDRGFFTFDPKTDTYGEVPEDFVMTSHEPRVTKGHVCVDFGDAFILNAYLNKSGLMKIVDCIPYKNRDTLHAMLLFYMLSGMANCNAIHWYEGSIARDLYPNANMKSQRISEFLAAIGTAENRQIYQRAYIKYVLEHYNPDRNLLIDSSGLPNGIHMPLTSTNVHNGKVSREVRLIFVVQRKTGLPLFYQAVPGNIIDSSTLERVFLHLDSLGIDVESCIMDCGYDTGENLDLFYNEEHKCCRDFITRVKSNDSELKKMILEELPKIDRKENFIKYQDRYLFVVKRSVMVGKNKDNPAWMYLGMDCDRATDEQHKLFRKAGQKKLSTDDIFDAMQTMGLFGITSGKEYACEEILPAYYQRQMAEQIFDFAKNYTKLLPLQVATEETFQGHLLLSYIASCAVKMLQNELKTADLFLGSRLQCMRNQKCTVYENRIVTDMPQREANETYTALKIDCPASIKITNGVLQYVPPKPDDNAKKATQKKSKSNASGKKAVKKQTPAEGTAPRKRGRPKGSKNKKTLEREALMRKQGIVEVKRGRGRPKGSKNKKTLEREAQLAAQNTADNVS